MPNQQVNAIGLQSDGKIVIGGGFSEFGNVVRLNIARLLGESLPTLPQLSFARSNESLTLSWPVSLAHFELHERTSISIAGSWSPVAQPSATNNGRISITIPTTAGSKFFQLLSE